MIYWTTEIIAIDPIDGQEKLWQGPYVPGRTIEEAMEYCQMNGLGYCQVVGKHIETITWEDVTARLN